MQNFSPFPLRARGIVEQLDAAIKLYKQYFWVLIGWSAVVTLSSLASGLIGFFLTPMMIGACVCCVAAAVRGQSVEFGQCSRFTQPRYWSILWYSLLASFIGGIFIAILVGAMVALGIAVASALGNSPAATQIIAGILGVVMLGSIATLIATFFLAWLGLVPVVVCMEDDKRNFQSLRRSFNLLRGHWLRISALLALAGLALTVLGCILGGVATLLVGIDNIRRMMSGNADESAAMIGVLGLLGFGGAYTLLWMLWTPVYYLILTVFYLDVRVRQEALDLEWTAHATAPEPVFAATPNLTNQNAPFASHLAPQGSETGNANSGGAVEFTPQTPAQIPSWTEYSPPEEKYGTRRLDDISGNAQNAVGSDYAPSPFATSTHDDAAPNAQATNTQTSNSPTPDDNGVVTPQNNPSLDAPGASTPHPINPTGNEPPRPQW